MINDCEYNDVKLPSKVYQRIEERVASLYVEQNINKVPINPFDIADRRGYIVKPFSDLNEQARLRLFTKKLDGTSYFDPILRKFVIYYDNTQIIERIRFTVMHEIGHIDLGHRQESDLARKMADYYAAYSLAPSPIIHICSCEDYIDVANRFNVSHPCADNCFRRYENWFNYGGKAYKEYELRMLNLFQYN
jgi:Zn-dependent peptidase ImmA (M78 family)